MTSTDVAKRLGWSQGKLTKMELGEWLRPNPRDIRDLCELYEADPHKREELETLAKEGREKEGWWHPYRTMVSQAYSTYIGLEAGASELLAFDPLVINGLLQTASYARAIVTDGPEELSAEQVEQRVQIRAERQQFLTRSDDPLRLWVVLHEAALRTVVGDDEIMREQLLYLLQMSALAKVTVQIVPFSAGAHPGVMGGFTILSFPEPEDPGAIYIENPAGELFLEEPAEVSRFKIAHQRLLAKALNSDDSRHLIKNTAECPRIN